MAIEQGRCHCVRSLKTMGLHTVSLGASFSLENLSQVGTFEKQRAQLDSQLPGWVSRAGSYNPPRIFLLVHWAVLLGVHEMRQTQNLTLLFLQSFPTVYMVIYRTREKCSSYRKELTAHRLTCLTKCVMLRQIACLVCVNETKLCWNHVTVL